MTVSSSPASTTTYHVDPHYRTTVYFGAIPLVLLFGVIVPVIGFVAAIRSPSAIAPDTFAIIALSLTFAVASLWGVRRWSRETWLTVSTNGLTYHTPGLTIQTSWENIERIEDRFGKVQCWLRHRSASSMSPWTVFWRWTSSASWNIDRRIPLSVFPWSRQSQLRNDIAQFAPHLTAVTAPKRSQRQV